MLEFVNKVELQGIVGNVRTYNIENKSCIRFSIATERCFRQNGDAVIETTWHQIVWWVENELVANFIKKGAAVSVLGRLKRNQYVGSDGVEHSTYEVYASQVILVAE